MTMLVDKHELHPRTIKFYLYNRSLKTELNKIAVDIINFFKLKELFLQSENHLVSTTHFLSTKRAM